MSLMQGLLRPSRRQSSIFSEPVSDSTAIQAGRASEQIPRRPSETQMSSLSAAMDPAAPRRASVDHSLAVPVQEDSHKHRRFSMLKFRHASDSQLATKARLQAETKDAPPLPQPPAIITTAPTIDMNASLPSKKKSRLKLAGRAKTYFAEGQVESQPARSTSAEALKVEKKERRKTMAETAPSGSKGRVTFDEPTRPATQGNTSPPAYGDEESSTLALPINRLSESSRSDGSSGDHGVYATTTTTTHTVHTTTTFFRLPRRRKATPMFDLSHLPQKSQTPDPSRQVGPPRVSGGSSRFAGSDSPAVMSLRAQSTDDLAHGGFASPLPSPSSSALAQISSSFAAPAVPLFRQGSTASTKSSPTRSRLGLRGRSSTLSSLRGMPVEDPLPTPTIQSTRTSTSTGRKSFGDLFGLSHRLRQNSEPPFPRNGSGMATPGSNTSKHNSVQITREAIVLPERYEDDTPAKYLVRLEEAISRGVVASVLSKGTDPFSAAVLRSYMRGFGFFGDPMDMAIRKLLMEVELPKETQQIDRCLQGFANRYHECNPGIYASPDQAYFIAFSLLILHTDVFNKNNKHKMQKPDYLKNTRGEGIFDEILECFYDNISYTPFIHVEDDLDINGERILPHKMKRKSLFPRASADPIRKPSKEPVDPYTLIIDSKLDSLRPNLKEVMPLEEHYSYLGTASSLNLQDLQKTFFKTGILQIVSARSRPDAFMSDKTVNNTDEAQAGIVDIKITKVGLLWRKDSKKKKTRSPWQEWGAILTGAQLYFFRNTAWIKSLMHQYETHVKQGHDGIPVIFKPPLDTFKPDALMSTDDSVALLDSTYKKHKNAFIFVRHGGFEETFLADNEQEMNDWLAKLNYAAAFRTSGVRMRGVVGGNYDGQRTRGIRRLDSHTGGNKDSTKSVQTPTGEVTIVSGKIDVKMAQDILAARREIMLQKVADAEEKLLAAQKQLDAQLRNARHLQILSPIQQKTRDQVLLAAGRMAAQLKWGRMEIWKLRCHRDILTMDLEEEKSPDDQTRRPDLVIDTPSSDRTALGRLHTKASSISLQRTPRSPTQNLVHQPSPITQDGSSNDGEQPADDVFHTPATSNSTFHKSQASWELPPISLDSPSARKASAASLKLTSSPVIDSTPSRSSLKPVFSGDSHRSPSPNIDADELAILEQSGYVEPEKTPDGKRPTTGGEAEESKDLVLDKEKSDRGKIRRSLHRTLREAHVPTHHRSRKGKESSSSANLSDEAREDVLSRGTGSFVVHGKKASVITFGSELQSMSPDERLRLRKQPHKNEAHEDDFHSVLAEPVEYHDRRGSATSTSTATAKSFRNLHQELAGPSFGTNTVTSDGDDSEAAASLSEGVRTPLPHVDDDEDDDEDEHPDSDSKQAIFYTPEASNTPVTALFHDSFKGTTAHPTHDEDDHGNHEVGSEQLAAP